VTDRFQDGRRRHVGNSSERYKLGNYHPILLKIGTETKTDMLSSKIMKAEVYRHFHDGRHCYLGKSSACYKMGNYGPTLMKFDTQTKTDKLNSKITKAEVYCKKAAKFNCKKRYRFKKATLYEREVCGSEGPPSIQEAIFKNRTYNDYS
jgi:hypothetical protein